MRTTRLLLGVSLAATWTGTAAAADIKLRLFSATSAASDQPQVQVKVPDGYSVIGGGAHADWNGTDPGQLLIWSYPQDEHTWFAASKAHSVSSPMTLTAYAIAIENPGGNRWDVMITSSTSSASSRPTATATVASGYVMTGGGARAELIGAGQLLVASFPSSDKTWEARSKDHSVAQPVTITAYVIGLKSKSSAFKLPPVQLTSAQSSESDAPSVVVNVADGCAITGGGARTTWADPSPGNLLVASNPLGQNAWSARSKAHSVTSPAAVVAYALYVCEGQPHRFFAPLPKPLD
jgi:hypothetical protein